MEPAAHHVVTWTDELVEEIDEKGAALRVVSRAVAHQDGLLHAVVVGMLKGPDGRLVLARQTSDRQDAGKLVCPVGGHVLAGESEEEALWRETEEETGVELASARRLGSFLFRRTTRGQDENHLFALFELEVAEPLLPGPETTGYANHALHELISWAEAGASEIADPLRVVLLSFYRG